MPVNLSPSVLTALSGGVPPTGPYALIVVRTR